MDALGRKQIFHTEWNAFKSASSAFSNARIRSFCHFPRLFRRCGNIGIDRLIGGIDRRNIGFRQFGRGNRLGLQLVARFGNGQCGQFAHRQILSVRLNETLFKKGAVFGVRIIQNHAAARKT